MSVAGACEAHFLEQEICNLLLINPIALYCCSVSRYCRDKTNRLKDRFSRITTSNSFRQRPRLHFSTWMLVVVWKLWDTNDIRCKLYPQRNVNCAYTRRENVYFLRSSTSRLRAVLSTPPITVTNGSFACSSESVRHLVDRGFRPRLHTHFGSSSCLQNYCFKIYICHST